MKKHLRLISLTGALLFVIAAILYWQQPGPIFYFTAGWLLIIALLLWFGNRQLTIRLDKLLPWSNYGNIRFFVQLLLALAYLLFLVNSIYYGIKVSLTSDAPTPEQFVVMNVWGAAIFIPIFSLYFSLHFLRHWRTSELEVEKNQKERMRSQLNSLKNHLDPHFLFNNLNILASLIDKDQQASKAFIEKFAEVYRWLLNTKSDDLIPLADELDFIQAYMYLMRVRFENHIEFNASIAASSRQKLIPPLTLQMLIENAIKHNLITEEVPLRIQLSEQPHYLVVRNSLLPSKAPVASGGSGLENIKQRYAHFSDLPVIVHKTAQHFEVHIPLLDLVKE